MRRGGKGVGGSRHEGDKAHGVTQCDAGRSQAAEAGGSGGAGHVRRARWGRIQGTWVPG